MGGSRQKDLTRGRVLDRYEASLARTLERGPGRPGSHPPAMDMWAMALGVEMDKSKSTERARRKVELEEAGKRMDVWASPVPPITHQPQVLPRRRKRGREALGGAARGQAGTFVPDVTALDGFLSDLQLRLFSVEGGAVTKNLRTDVPRPSRSVRGGSDTGRRGYERQTPVPAPGGPHAAFVASTDVYGIPEAFIANAEEARRRWDTHHANLERRDEEFLLRYKRSARMSVVQVSIAKAWRGFVFRRRFLAWKGRRQWAVKRHIRAWCVAVRAERLYSGHLKRSVFTHWNDIVEEERNTRVMGQLSFQAAVSSIRLSRQAVVQFFQDLAPSATYSTPEVLRNKASVKRRIMKILFQGWRDAASLKQKAAAQAAFKMSKAVRLHTASAMLWSPEIVSLLFQVWSRMVLFKKAVREERETPTFLPEAGYRSLPEWDMWVASKGRHLALKRRVMHTGSQIFIRNKFRRWVWFAKWSLSQEERVMEASQHYDANKMTQAFAAWASVCRDRGSMLRRITKCWQGWSTFASRKKKTKLLKEKAMEHLRLLRTGSVMSDILAYARDRKILAAFTVSKLVITTKGFGGMALSCVATGRTTQLYALLAWQALKKYTFKRRRWKWLLYEHSKTEAFHAKQAVFRAWSYATGRRHRPDAASLTLTAALPFSTWDRLARNYVDQGVIPLEQLRKDMVGQSIMQNNTAWWLLNEPSVEKGNRDSNSTGAAALDGLGAVQGSPRRGEVRKELAQSGSGGGGARGRMLLPGGSKDKKEGITSDWRTLAPALFAAVDDCDTAMVIDLLHQGAQVNCVYMPPEDAPAGRSGTSKNVSSRNNQDEEGSAAGGHGVGAGRALDLPSPALVARPDGTFEMRGTTPLHAAAGHFSADFTPIVVALLHAGAFVGALDATGRTPLQVCTSPQTAALLHAHASRLERHMFSPQEVRWGQQVLTSERSSVGAAGLWRYIVRAALVARLDKLSAALRREDARAEKSTADAARTSQAQGGSELFTRGKAGDGFSPVAPVGMDEREKELIRMKMERLDAAKTIIDREHALHGGTAGTPGGSSGVGGAGGGSAQDMKNLFHDLDKAIAQSAGEKQKSTTAGGTNSRGSNKRRSIGVSPINDHAKSRERTGKERTTADHRRAFSAQRAQAAAWFRSFQQDLAKAGMLPPRGGPPTDKSSPSTPAGGNGDAATAERVLDIVRGARGGENRGEGPGSGGGGRGAIAGGRLNSTAFGGGARGGMLGRGGNTSGTDAFNITEVLDCYVALDAVLKERKRVMDERGARDDGLIERGDWVGLRRAMEASKDDPASPSAKRRKKGRKNRPASLPTTTGDSPTHLDRSFSPAFPGIHLHDGVRADHAVSVEAAVMVPGGAAGGIQDDTVVSGELSIDVIPTSSSKRCHSSNVALRGTVDSEVMARAHRTISAWKSGSEASGSSCGHGRPAKNQSFGRGMLSRVPPGWLGRGGERVLVLMLDERRRLREKGAALSAQAKKLDDRLTSKSEKLEKLNSREREVGTTVRDVAMETKKSETRFREDMERWQEAIKQAQGKIRTIVRKQVNIAAQASELEDTLANWDTREIPTAAERSKKKKSKEAVEEITPQTLRRDINLKRELIVSLKAKEQQCLRTIESVKGQLEEGRVFLMRIQSILTKYASYNMGKMDTLENEFRELSRQQQTTRARRNVLGTQLQSLFKRLAELDEAILILRNCSQAKKFRGSGTGDLSTPQGTHGTDQDQTSFASSVGREQPSTSLEGSRTRKSGSVHGEGGGGEGGSPSKRKRSGDGPHSPPTPATLGNSDDDDHHDGRDQDVTGAVAGSEGGTGDDEGAAGAREQRGTAPGSSSSSSKVSRGPASSGTMDHEKETEAAMVSLIVLLDENTARIDNDLASLGSSGSTSVESGVKKGRKRHPKRSKAGSSTKGPASTGSPPGVVNDRGTRRPTTTPPAVDGVLPSTSPAPWATEGAGESAQQTPPPSTTPPASRNPKGARRRQGSPSSRKQATAGSGKRKRKQPARKKKAKNLSPRDSGNVEGQPAGSSATRATADKAGTSAVAEAVGKRERGQDRVDDDEGVLETQSASSRVVALGLTERERQEEMRDAKEARDLAEEEECRRAWDEEDAEEQEAWGARWGGEGMLEINPELSKEETVRLLATQYEQALKQTFEPERRAAVASRIAQVEAEQREKERKAGTADAETPEKRKPEIAPSEGGVPDIAGLMPSAEMPGHIGHLLDDPGLGLTRQELDTLFDLVDDQGQGVRITDSADGAGGGSDGGDGGISAGRQKSTQATRDVNRGLLLFLRRRGLRRSSKEPLEAPFDDLCSSPRPPAPLKPELPDYLSLNFIGGQHEDTQTGEPAFSMALTSSEDVGDGAHRGDRDGDNGSSGDDNATTQESVWRGSRSAPGTQPRSRPASTHARQPSREDVSRNTQETGDVAYGTEHDGGEGGSAEARLYPRTLGSSVSVLDEKDAVVRTGGTRFAGEDPIRGRLRATDPFLWMGRLHAGATAISSLIDQADGALAGLDDGSSDVESTASSGRGGNRRRTDRNDQVSRGRDGVMGPASRGSAKAFMRPGGRGGGMTSSVQNAEGLGGTKECDGHGSDRDEDNDKENCRGGTSAAEAGEEHWSSSESGAVDLMSSTMTSYSQAVETNRIMAGGMLMEMEEESGESGSDDPPDNTSAIERDSRRLEEPRKRPGIGSGPCPMRSPINARSAALGSSAKLRTIDAGRNGVIKALVAEADCVDITSPIVEDTDGHHLPSDVTQASVSTGPGDWAEDESQDICFDDIVSGINRDVASRGPPSPRHSTEAVSVSHHHAMRPPWSAQERASPTRQTRDGLSSQRSPGKDRRPRSTPAGFRARAEAASTVLDRRPPWSLPLDSVFAPRVKGAMQPNIILASPGRGHNAVGSPAGNDLEDRQHHQKTPRRTRSLVVLGASALHRQRQRTNAPSGVSAGMVPPRLPRSASSCAVGAGRGRDGDARNEDFETREDQNPSADERSASIRRCHSASEALLHSSLLHEAPRVDEAPAMTDGIWSWGWHEDGSSPDNLMSTASRDATSPVANPERCKNARGLGIRSTASQRRKKRGRSDSPEETPMGTRALPPQRSRGKDPSRRRSNSDGGSATLPSRGPVASSRPWTTGEFEGNDGSDERSAVSTSADKFWREGGVLLRQTRSADGLLLNSSTASTHPPLTKADNSAEEAFFSTAGKPDCAGDDEEGFLGLDDFDLQNNSGEEPGATGQTAVLDAIDGVAADGDDALAEEAIEFPGELIKNLARRVSFADESAVNRPADGSLDSGEQRSNRVVETEGWGAQRRRMSSLIGSSNGYLEGNGSISGHFLGRDGRRKSDLERCQKAMEIARAAHELLFNDTRPDGLRPITGSPMSDGRDAQGSGGLFVGLAGLKGFDLSFLGALSTDQGGGAKGPSSASSRLAANKRLSGREADAADDASDEKPWVPDELLSSPSDTRAVSPARSTNSRMAAGFLLDRKPGSLMANPPRSPGRDPSPGKSQAPPETSSTANPVAQDGEERQMVRNGFSPKRVRDNSESMKSAPGTGVPHSETSAAGEPPPMEDSCASPEGDELRRSEAPSTDDIRHGPDIPEGFGMDERESDAPRALRGSTDRGKSQSGEGKGRRGSGAGVMVGMAASASAAAAVGSIFAPKAAVLWSARDLGVDELVSSIVSGKKKPSRPGSSKYISRALLAAYRQATPVFEVEASSWRKREGAVAGVDYPSRPPSEWGWGGSDVGRGTREAITAVADEANKGAWRNFEQRPISRAEARALQELRISRSIPGRTRPPETGTFVSLCSSENSTATSLETEDHASLTSSIIAQGSETSIATAPFSLAEAFPDDHYAERRRRMQIDEIPDSRERIASTTPPPHGDRAKSSKRAKSTIVEGNHLSRSRFRQQRRRRPGCDGGGFDGYEDERQDPSTANGSPARDDARYAGSEFSTAPTPARGGAMHSVEPRLDVERDRGGKCLSPGTAGQDCKGGESSPNWGNISPTGEAPSVAPSSGYGLGAGLGAASESAFRLSGEADADDVVRAMVRLSSASPGTGIGAGEEGTRYNARHQRGNVSVSSREVKAHRRTASRSRGSNTAQAEAGSRLLSSADRSNGGICRGSTPAIRSGQCGSAQPPVRIRDGCSPAVGDKTLDIEGRPLQSEEGMHKAGRGLSRSRRKVAPPTCGLPVSSSEPDQAGRSSAAPQGRSRSRRDKPVAERPGREGTFLLESRSAPSMVSQQERKWPLASSLRGDSAGRAGGAGDGSAGGVMSEESLMQTHSSSALALNSVSSRSYAVSLASGASQQLRPLASIDTSLGGDGLESNEPATSRLRRSNSDGNRRRSSSTPVSATAGGSLSSSIWQGQEQPLQTRPITEQGQSRVPAIGDSSSGRIEPQEKSVGHDSTARRGEAKPAHASLDKASPMTLGDADDDADVDANVDDGDDGDDKTTGEQMSVIIEGVTRDAAMSVFSSGRRGRPLSPIKSTADTVAAFTAGPHVDVRTPQAPSTCATDTQPSAGASAYESMSGNGRAGQMFKSKGRSIGSGNSVTGESAAKERSSTPERGARGTAREEGDSLRFDGKEEASSIAAARSPVALSSASRQNSSKAGGPKVYSAKPHKGGSVRARQATIDSDASVTPLRRENITTSEPLPRTSPSPCVVLEEEHDTSSSAELVKGSGNQLKSFGETGNHLPRTTNSIESRTTEPGGTSGGQAKEARVGLDKPRGDTGRSLRETDLSRSGNGGRTIASDGSSLNSQGSSMSSRSGAPSNTHARRNRSSQKAHHQVGDEERGSTTRGGVRAKKGSAPGEANASVTETALLAVAEQEGVTGASRDGQQDDIHQGLSRNSKEAHGGAASKKSENDEVHPLPRASGAAVASGGRAKTSGGTAGKSPQSAIKVRTRPARVEDRDLHTTTEALTRHHLAVGELLKVEYDELLDGSDDEDDAAGRRVRTRKEPLMIPQGSRQNGMAYWRAKGEKERVRQRRPRSATDNPAAEANTGNRAGNGRDVHAGGAESGGPLAGANPQWGDEKEEIKRLLTAARARREAAVARVRAQREQAIIDSETDSLGQAAAGDTSTPPASEQGSRSLLPKVDAGPALASATAVRAGSPADEKEPAVSLPAVAGAAQNDEGGEVGQGRSEQIKGRAPPWKGFTLGDDGEAMLRRRRAPSPDRVSPVEGREDWEYQLIVPGMKDNLVNFSVDTAAVRANFGKLRRGVEIRNRMGLDDTDAGLHDGSSDEVEATESTGGNDVPEGEKSTPATPQERRSNASFACDNKPPGTRESIFSSEASGTAGGIPDIPIRRRTRVAGAQGGVTSGGATVPSAGVRQAGAIAQASRIIPELELEHGSMVFPLDSLRGDADFDDDNEDT